MQEEHARWSDKPTRPSPGASAAARRAVYLDIMRRRTRPGSGSTLAFLRSRSVRPMPDLNALLLGVRYVVVGGTATSLYMPARTTEDVDILVAAPEASQVEQALRRAGATLLGRLSIGGTSWQLPDGTRLDVLYSVEAWVEEALARPNRDPAGLPIVALPYLVLLKLEASRGVDIGDLTRMLGGADDAALAEVRVVVGRYLPDAARDVESLIQLGLLEFQAATPPTPELSGTNQAPAGESASEIRVREHVRRGRRVREHRRRRPSR